MPPPCHSSALEKCNRPPGRAGGSQASLDRRTIFSKDKCYNAHHFLALPSEKPSWACLTVGIKTDSDQCALWLVHVIPSTWNTFPHLVNTCSSSQSQLNHFFREAFWDFLSWVKSPTWHSCSMCTLLNYTVTDTIGICFCDS